jgi:hypothetical protein
VNSVACAIEAVIRSPDLICATASSGVTSLGSCAPHRHGRAIAGEVAQLILGLRQRRRYWGPRKLKAVLEHNHPELSIQAASTIGDLLRRSGLCRARRRRLRAPAGRPFAQVKAPNDLWGADFKGWFRTADGQRCDPLTITDAYSRFPARVPDRGSQLRPSEVAVRAGVSPENDPTRHDAIVTRFIPLQIKRRGVELRLLIPGAHTQRPKVDLALLKAVGRARRWFDQLASGRATSLAAIASQEGISVRYVGRLLRLAFLAPDRRDDRARTPAGGAYHRDADPAHGPSA